MRCDFEKWQIIWSCVFWLFFVKLWITMRVSVTNCLIGMGVAVAVYFAIRYYRSHDDKTIQ